MSKSKKRNLSKADKSTEKVYLQRLVQPNTSMEIIVPLK
jgi:hypothetical protein